MDLEKQKLKIKGALVYFYRNADSCDYLEALNCAIKEIQTIKNINYICCSSRLKANKVITFEEYKTKHLDHNRIYKGHYEHKIFGYITVNSFINMYLDDLNI